MISILFVCLGNICRSPMAEAIFRDLLKKHKMTSKVKVDSAGIGEWHVGKAPHPETCEILSKNSICYDNMFARQVSEDDFERFDFIIVMDNRNLNSILELAGDREINVRPLKDFILDEHDLSGIPDPNHTGDFEEAYRLVEAGCDGLLASIQKDYNL